MLDLTAQDGNTAALPTQPEDESNRDLLLTRTKASIIKLPFPSIALPSGVPAFDRSSSPSSPVPPILPTPLPHSQLLSPVACSLSGSAICFWCCCSAIFACIRW